MSSRFVSAGAINAATGEAAAPPSNSNNPSTTTSTSPPPTTTTTITTTTATTTAPAPQPPNPTPKQAAWAAATAQLEADRRRREEARQAASSANQPSLYDVLQANKAAKQAAFEEAHRLRNQFRALDDDEVDFLDEVRVRKREEEERARREVERGVRAFRDAQQRKGAVPKPMTPATTATVPPAQVTTKSTAKPGGLLVDYGSDDDEDD
ncbi:N-terminal domain of NEFA-interacting nuclear protein NIP30-domain-containing protein [Chaetomium tenue]|uniref:N-terminal domain of NEFA-interacting nuclear protein NIP30-domain-containing protein n=1 Tax=Chaetomium tenue TaxID=1854479 RepID=A0ACB7PD00_9PEZI|nr:N-terminal domain of NEFA-interacting nuclear protein NIP30-domain-containing protein [Chaetomium globosum]